MLQRPINVLFCPDSFKGSLSAIEMCDIAAAVVDKRRVNLTCLPLADGGEGTTAVLSRVMGMDYHTVATVDPLMRPIGVQIAHLPWV